MNPPPSPSQTVDPAWASEENVPFGSNEVRLTPRHWLISLAILGLILFLTPILWPWLEPLHLSEDSRIPYSLSEDYWLYNQRLKQIAKKDSLIVLGDSVVWGEYVQDNGTLSHFLNETIPTGPRFANCGVNGQFPLALEGLTRYYGDALHQKKILLNANLLWMSSPEADLQSTKEQKFNHTALVPQWTLKIPCYRASLEQRLSLSIQRSFNLFSWVKHLQIAYLNHSGLMEWTLKEDMETPGYYPNAKRFPWSAITLDLPREPAEDPERGPNSHRHRSWIERGIRPQAFAWVQPETSLQWNALQRLIKHLIKRGNSVFILIGPFNEALIAESAVEPYQAFKSALETFLTQNQIPYAAPLPLPPELYGDASHPLTEGYQTLAQVLSENKAFQDWLQSPLP